MNVWVKPMMQRVEHIKELVEKICGERDRYKKMIEERQRKGQR